MPPQASQSSNAPPLPPGYTLDAPASGAMPPLPPGYTLDSQGKEPGFLDKEIPLDSYKNATLQGVQSVGRGVRDAVSGLGNMVMHPIDTAKGIADLPSQAAQVPAAVKDINASPDPVGTYAKVAQETAGQGAGQTLTALATEGVLKGASASKPIVRGALRAASDVVDPDLTGIASPRLAHAQRLAGKIADKLGDKPTPEGKPLLSKEPLGPETPDPDLLKARNLTTAETPAAAPASQTGEALGQIPRGKISQVMKQSESLAKPAASADVKVATPEALRTAGKSPADALYGAPESAPASQTGEALGQIKRGSISKAVNSPARTLPGQVSPEVIQPPSPQTAAPIPPRQGLALPAAPAGAELSELPATGAKPAAESGEALGVKRGSIAKAVQQPITRGSLSQMLQEQLGQGLGASKLDPKMPLRQQLDSMPAKASADIPEGHTPVQSSALRSYKYDPATREFHARATSGDTTYIYGDVSPEEAASFEQAESKGKAWQQIRQNPLVGKVVNGKRLSVTASR